MADKWKCQDHETDEDEEPATKIKIREKKYTINIFSKSM